VTEQDMARAAELIRGGGLVAFPTETVYGLGANALDAEAIQRIYRAKGRPPSSPIIVHVADEEMAKSISAEWPPLAHLLAARFWPGPLTLVVKKSPAIPDAATAGLGSVGIRVPRHPVALDLVRRAGVPIAAPSANRFTQISPTTADHVRAALGDRVDLILDGGPTTVGIESTVVLLTREPPVVLRPGMVSRADLEAATGLIWSVGFQDDLGAEDVRASPGRHPRHYTPRTPFYILGRDTPHPAGNGRILDLPQEPHAYATRLYAELHNADAEGWDWIAVEKPPETPEWEGILDRIKKASTPRA